jgi:hypothetical protein
MSSAAAKARQRWRRDLLRRGLTRPTSAPTGRRMILHLKDESQLGLLICSGAAPSWIHRFGETGRP